MNESVVASTDFDKLYIVCNTVSNRDLVALVPGAKWRENRGHWELNLTWASCKQLRSTFGEALFLDDTVIDWATQELESRITPCMELRNCLYPSDLGIDTRSLDPRLYGYQAAGAQFLASAYHGILSDPPGAGKTATAISAARILEDCDCYLLKPEEAAKCNHSSLPALVVAPKSTLVSWGREVEQWWPGTPVYVVDGTKEKRSEIILEAIDKPGFVVIGWEAVRRHSRLSAYGSMELRHCSNCDRNSTGSIDNCHRCDKELNQVPFRLVIADEAHRMQKPQSIQTRAVWHLGDSPSVNHRWALTGTPLTNQIDSLWSILRFINKEEWPSRVTFIERYALTRIVPWGSGSEVIGLNPDHEEEFQEIFQPRFRRMPKEIILPQLPPIQRTRRYLAMTGSQRRAYEQMRESMLAVTESGELLIAANPAVKMLRMVQFSSATVDIINMAEDEGIPDFWARLVDPSNKLDVLMDDLPDLIAAGEQVAVFAVSRQLIEMAEKRLTKAKIKYSVIKGNQKQSFRQEQIDDFQNSKVSVILVVIAAGGVGITLTAARIGIFLQRSWSFIDNHQSEGRLHRIGSEIHKSIEYIDYISEGTVDEVVVEVAEGKELRLEEIVRDREAVRRLLAGEIID